MSQGAWVTDERKIEILAKLEPYLKSGLSLRKACLETDVSNKTVSKIMNEDEGFRDKINQFQQYLAILTSNVFYGLLIDIAKKRAELNNAKRRYEKKEITAEEYGRLVTENYISKDELELLKWHSTKSKITREEYGDRQDLNLNTEEELKRINELIESKVGSRILPENNDKQ